MVAASPRVLQRTEIESLRDSGVRISQQSKYPDSAWQGWHSEPRALTAPHLYVVQSLVSSKNSDLSSSADYHLPNWEGVRVHNQAMVDQSGPLPFGLGCTAC